MSQEKFKIASTVNGYPYWAPLMPIVEFCLERGCKLDRRTIEQPFYEGREGESICRVYGSITIDDILEHFELPDYYEATEKFISYEEFRTYLIIGSLEDLEKTVKGREETKKKLEERRDRIRKKRKDMERLNSKDKEEN